MGESTIFFLHKKVVKKGAISRREVIDAHSAPGIFGPISFQYIFVLYTYFYFVLIVITIFRSKCCADSKFLESDFTLLRLFFTKKF